jgi:hypothetical protein
MPFATACRRARLRDCSEPRPAGSDKHFFRNPLEILGRSADKYFEDTEGIPNESGEPRPGMMTGRYRTRDAKNAIDSNKRRFSRSAELR